MRAGLDEAEDPEGDERRGGADRSACGSVVVLSPRTSRATSAIEASCPMAIGTSERSTARRLRSCIPRETAKSQPMAGLMPW